MKTTTDFNKLIDENISAIDKLTHDYNNCEFKTREHQARAYKELRKKIGKYNDEIKHLRRLVVFVETVSEEGVRMMRDKLHREIQLATATAYRMFDPESTGKNKTQVQKYLLDASIPLKKGQLRELDFILK